ncbi:MAG: hypothetical protein AAB553_05055 [Patescibacteria group bacterium]
MTEVSIPHDDFSRDIIARGTSANRFADEEIAKRHGREYVATGTDRIVIVDPTDPTRVLALERDPEQLSPKAAEELLNLHGIYATLFPHNFPEVYEAQGTTLGEEGVSGTSRQRIQKSRIPLPRRLAVRYPFLRVEAICSEVGIPLDIDRQHSKNFMTGRDRGEYYVDTLYPLSRQQLEKLHAIAPGYMEQQGFSAADREKVAKCLTNLNEITSY